MENIKFWKLETAVKTLVANYRLTNADTREAGRAWYPTAGQVAGEIGNSINASRETGAGIIAALSPLNGWSTNVWQARELALDPANSPRRTLGGSDRKARRIAQGESPLDVLGGNKVRAFYAAILGDTSAIVIDRWAQRGTGYTTKAEGACTDAQYALQ
jgi:hypothetical protein